MEYLMTLKDLDVFEKPEHSEPESYEERQTVKIVVKNKEGKIALITNPIHKLYLLPGGGVESGDLKKEAVREVLEEINFNIEVTGEIGKIEEFRNRNAKHYITTGFVANVISEGDEDTRTQEEKDNGLEVKWFTKEKALNVFKEQVQMVKEGKIGFYNTAFNIIRDYNFLSQM